MPMHKQTRNTWLFIGFLLLAGAANVLSRVFNPEAASLMTALNYVILTGLLLFWIQSVRTRLLSSAVRTYILSAAFLMLLFMLLRIFRYRFAVEPVVMRYAVYAYFFPQLLIPALFLMACIRIRRGDSERGKKNESLLLIPACLLTLAVMTNDLHALVYVPKISLSSFAVDNGTYSYGVIFYFLYVWMILAVGLGLALLLRWVGRFPKGAARQLLTVISLWFGYLTLFSLVFDRMPHSLRPFNMPETHIFGLLGVFEVCIRYRMIPYNEEYSGFFHAIGSPVLVTDRQLNPVYRTKAALPAGRGELKAVLESPVELPGDQKLFGKEIRGGYAFWTEDESAVRRAQARLEDANETIAQENELIRAETEQKEKDAYLQSKHRIYHEIAAELYPVQKRIAGLLSEAITGTESFRDKIAQVSVLNAYVKRKTNLLLLASEKERLSLRELLLALQESAGYLTLAGMQTTADMQKDEELSTDRVLALYDAFEQLAEQLLGAAPSMMVSLSGRGLRISAKTDRCPETSEIRLPVRFLESEGILYITVSAERAGDAT